MREMHRRFRKEFLVYLTLSGGFLHFLFSPQSFANDADQDLDLDDVSFVAAKDIEADPPSKDESYTINFNNVSIIEYIKFISKISNLNFVFNDADLQFNVTIVSEEPITLKNIMSALIQVLRIHDLSLLEQENNLIITKNKDVKQIATIISSETPSPETERKAAIVTRVFRLKNASLSSVASIIRPMMSSDALVEVSNETRQLIVTDITTNVDKIASLLASIDAPHTPLEIDTYTAKNINPIELIALATQIVTPFAEGNPLIFVPQPDSNTIFLVSTPYLIERTLTVLEDLDTRPKGAVTGLKPVSNENVFIYKIQRRSGEDLVNSLKQIANELKVSPSPPVKLVDSLEHVKWIKDSNSLLVIGDPDTLTKVKEILAEIDTGAGSSTNSLGILLYKPKFTSRTQIETSLLQLADKLSPKNALDQSVTRSIKNVTWLSSLDSFLFQGDQPTLDKVQDLLSTVDSATAVGVCQNFYLYKLQYVQGDLLEANLKKVAQDLIESCPMKSGLIQALQSVRWVKESNSLLITGSQDAIDELKQMIPQFDVPGAAPPPPSEKTSFLIYKPKALSADTLQVSLTDIAKDLKESGLADTDLLQALTTSKYVEATNSLLFTGTSAALVKVQDILTRVDVTYASGSAIQQVGSVSFVIYKLEYVTFDQLSSSLKAFASDLQQSHSVDKDLVNTINSMRYIKENNSVLFTGNQLALEKVLSLVQKFDISTLASKVPSREGAATFFVYNPKYQTGDQLIAVLCEFKDNLQVSGVKDASLFETIDHLKWIESTHSLLISGPPEAIAKVQELLEKFDVPTGEKTETSTIEAIENTSFLVYKLQYHQGSDIQTSLKQIAADLASTSTTINQNLLNAINSIQWVKMTNSLLATGEQDVLTKVNELIKNLDVPLRQVFIEVLIIQTTLGNAQNFGLQWGGKFQYKTKFAGASGNQPAPSNLPSNTPGDAIIGPLGVVNGTNRFPLAANPNGVLVPDSNYFGDIPLTNTGWDLGVIGDIIMHKGRSFISLASLVNALQTDSDSTVVLNPKIITQDNNNSTIFVGQNIPFTGSSIINTSQAGSTLTTTNLEYRDVGMNLSITPILGNGDVVTLSINNDLTNVSPLNVNNNVNGTNGGQFGIQTTHAMLNTKVQVPDKNFLIISGMINDTKNHFKSGIPCLGGLPVIGFAFSENDRQDLKNNIVIFIRPHIIRSADDYRQLTEHQENVYKDQAVLPILKEQFDAGIDIVKTPENE